MRLPNQVRVVSMDGPDDSLPRRSTRVDPLRHQLEAPLRSAIVGARQRLISDQHADGYWEGELEGDSILQSEFILLLAYLGRETTELAQQAARRLVRTQRSEGGWAMIPGGALEISASVKAYFALKLTGHDPSRPYMQRAREAILAAGGAERVNSFTRFYLALLGQIGYEQCPDVPPEMMLLPKWFPINLYRISAWSRTIVVPLSIMSALKPVREIDSARGIRELYLTSPDQWPALRSPGQPEEPKLLSWQRFFRFTDRSLKFLRRHRITPLQNRAIAKAKSWMLQRFEQSDGLGAIFPPIVWSIIALDALGYDADSSEMRYCHEKLEDLILQDDDSLRVQPCKSPVWDTALTLRALSSSGVQPATESITRATDWLLNREVQQSGDWSETVSAAPGGWFFEHQNAFYPDVDDTAMVLLALREQWDTDQPAPSALPPELQLVEHRRAEDKQAAHSESLRVDRVASATSRAIDWTLAMQNRDGGWGAFDRDNDHAFLCQVPFADHNAMIDPSTPDLTARVLEALGAHGHTKGQSHVDRALAYLRETQEADGSWFGRWGVNYIYGTWQALVGMVAVGVSPDDPAIAAGANWLMAHQQPNGGWGETADSYEQPHLRGQGPTTASQTAWAILGLIAAGFADHPATTRGVKYLLKQQQDDGAWEEPEFTGTGFPQVFYLRYHMYPIYFPLMALSRWAVSVGTSLEEDEPISLRLAESTIPDGK